MEKWRSKRIVTSKAYSKIKVKDCLALKVFVYELWELQRYLYAFIALLEPKNLERRESDRLSSNSCASLTSVERPMRKVSF